MAKGRKTGGAVKGQTYAKVTLWNEMGDWIASEGCEKYMAYLKSLTGEEFARRFEAVLEYFKPKLARTENKTDVTVSMVDKVLDKIE